MYSIVFMLLSSESSALNNILMGLGISQRAGYPLTNAKHAWLIQVAIGAWKTLGYNAIIYLSAITSIDQKLYQAADVDGALIPGENSTCYRSRTVIHLLCTAAAGNFQHAFQWFRPVLAAGKRHDLG